MIKKKVIIGLLIGLIANCVGIGICAFIFTQFSDINDSIIDVIKAANAEGFLGKLISLGAIPNLLVFFWFLKKNEDYKARGVLIATVITAIVTFLIKL